MGIFIILSYFASVADSQILPKAGSKEERVSQTIEMCFTVIFALEILFNMFGSWYQDFISDGWSVFDFIVVAISIISLLPGFDIPGILLARSSCQSNVTSFVGARSWNPCFSLDLCDVSETVAWVDRNEYAALGQSAQDGAAISKAARTANTYQCAHKIPRPRHVQLRNPPARLLFVRHYRHSGIAVA